MRRPIITIKELRERLEKEFEANPVIHVDGARYRHGSPWQITSVEIEEHDGTPRLILYQRNARGEEVGVIVDRQYAEELTESLGPHPLVEKFFRAH